MELLTISDISLSFGGLKALSKVDMEIQSGLITSIIGPNGAGKTSLLNCISGFYHPTSGEIHYNGRRLTHSSPHQVSKMGIARAFQNLELFSGMTVLDNLLLARHQNLRYNFFQAIIYAGKTSRVEAENRNYVEEEKEDMVRFVMDIRKERNTTVVLVEHDLGVVMDISDHIYVLDFGELIGYGQPEEVAVNPKVIEAYIGE
ncbi:MAG: ABC transporter ATP-binding protein [Deltaproteobacteria bacterium]|nr:ABC transporter ATP-binding protein [Deltaproteobacteria bacterium]